MPIHHNVCIRVIDEVTHEVVSSHTGHNAATYTMLDGIARYISGQGILQQGPMMLDDVVPRYISLGTMGLLSKFGQYSDNNGLPLYIGETDINNTDDYDEQAQYIEYMKAVPGFGADGYSILANNNRTYFGLGPDYLNRSADSTAPATQCELVSPSYLRTPINFRQIVSPDSVEAPNTCEVIFSAMIPVGGLKAFRQGADHIFITETGLWGKQYAYPGKVEDTKSYTWGNGLLAAYRIVPPSTSNWDMSLQENRDILRENIIRVGVNQVVQVIWKIQIGNPDAFPDTSTSIKAMEGMEDQIL